jgi:YesN/AraC family two-component response regulator
VLAHVAEHCREPITLEQVAALVHVSPSRVRHVFKEVTGVGFKEYVTQVRVAEAKRLLVSTDLSVAEVAQSVSYTNLSQFYKVFDRATSMSPAEYRRYYTPAAGEGRAAQAW